MDPRRKVTSGSRALIFTTEKNSSPIVIGPSSEPKLFKKGTKIEKSDFSAKKWFPAFWQRALIVFRLMGINAFSFIKTEKTQKSISQLELEVEEMESGFFRDSEIIDSR